MKRFICSVFARLAAVLAVSFASMPCTGPCNEMTPPEGLRK